MFKTLLSTILNMKMRRRGTVRFKLSNTRTLFSQRQPTTEPHALILPKDRGAAATLNFRSRKFSIFSHVQKKCQRELCEDTTIAYTGENCCVIGVFDGHGENGLIYSETVARVLLSLCNAPNNELSKLRPAELLKKASSDVMKLMPPLPGGTTASIALVLSDGRYLISSIGDSAAYIIGRKEVRRLMRYNHITISPDLEPTPLSEFPVTPKEYGWLRNVLAYSIGRRKLPEEAIESTEGYLENGALLMLASDGVTKNLLLSVNQEGDVVEVSGSSDLREIKKRKRAPSSVGSAVISAINQRLAGATDEIKPVPNQNSMVLVPQHDDISLIILGTK